MLFVANRFDASSGQHGGKHRSLQVAELIDASGVRATDPQPFGASSIERIREIGFAIRAMRRMPPRFRSLQSFRKLWSLGAALRRNRARLVISEAAYWWPINQLAAFDAPFIGVPQNIESLVPGQIPWLARDRVEDLLQECRQFERMAACFAICAEDAAIIGRYCDEVHVLPYYPPSEHLEWLRRIRQARESADCRSNRTGQILVLGTARNSPTRLGLCELLQELTDLGSVAFPKVTVCGLGTDELGFRSTDHLTIRGAVSNSDLMSLMIECKCLFVNHFPTSGSLTRVVDFLVAGVPVVLNTFAARGHSSLGGQQVFADLKHGLEMAADGVFLTPPEPTFPVRQVGRFIGTIQRYFP